MPIFRKWWILTRLQATPAATHLTITAKTNNAGHLFMHWAYYKPRRGPIVKIERGKRIICGYVWKWDTPYIVEQQELGETTTHNFFLENLIPGATIWYYLDTPPDLTHLPCQSPLFWVTLLGETSLFQHYNTGDDTEDCMYQLWWFAQSFTPEITHTIASIRLRLYRFGTPGILNASIQPTTGNQPTGVDLCAGSTDANSLFDSRPGEWRTITLDPPTRLEEGIKMAIVLKTPDATIGNRLCWRQDATSPSYDRGLFMYKRTTEETWYEWPDQDTMFEEWGY